MDEYTPVIQKNPPYGSKEWQRQQVQKQAIQPDTTIEELALGPGRLALAGAKSLAKKLVSGPKGKVPEFRIASQVEDMNSNIRTLSDHDYFPRMSPAARKEKEIFKNKEALVEAFNDTMETANKRAFADLGAMTYKTATEKKNKSETNKNYAKGGKVSSASNRADGCAQRGKTKGRFV
jgi:hypothetical protein